MQPIPRFLTAAQAAQRLGVVPQRMRLLLLQGRIRGAVKVGRDWVIPADFPDPRRPEGRPRGTSAKKP